MDTTKPVELATIDIESEATSFSALLADVKKVNRVEIVDFDNKPFHASVTGQKGQFSYIVRTPDGQSQKEGADTVAKLVLFAKLPVQVDKHRAAEFKTSKNFTKLRSALRRQKKALSEKNS